MDILLTSILMVWGSITSGGETDVTYEHLAQASKQAHIEQQAVVVIPPGDPLNPNGTEPIIKRDPDPQAPKVKGIYLTGHSAGHARMDNYIQLINETGLNAVVIDIKEDRGQITYKMEDPDVEAVGNTTKIIADIEKLMDKLNENEIYPIARIVVFKDTLLAHQKPEWSFLNSDGTVWMNDKKESYTNPYLEEVWEYNLAVAKEAARIGFKEIQFDYVRFPEGFERREDRLTFTKDERSRVEVINDFTQYAYEQLNPLGVRVSVDVFGYAASVKAADGIGQDFNGISRWVDVVSPMVYPSHYGTGWFQKEVPDAHPYHIINHAMIDSKKKHEEIGVLAPIIRPWIQDFTATWVPGYIKYGKFEVEEQIRALHDNGIEEYLIWNSSNVYSPGVDYK